MTRRATEQGDMLFTVSCISAQHKALLINMPLNFAQIANIERVWQHLRDSANEGTLCIRGS